MQQKQHIIKRLLVSLAGYWFFWVVADLVGEYIQFFEPRPATYHIAHALYMAIVFTVITHYKNLKQLFYIMRHNRK